jgi:hypothetical protein
MGAVPVGQDHPILSNPQANGLELYFLVYIRSTHSWRRCNGRVTGYLRLFQLNGLLGLFMLVQPNGLLGLFMLVQPNGLFGLFMLVQPNGFLMSAMLSGGLERLPPKNQLMTVLHLGSGRSKPPSQGFASATGMTKIVGSL